MTDFPDTGYYNWKIVHIKMEEHYYNNAKRAGVLLHDGKFVTEGIIFNKKEFCIIDENPLKLSKYHLRKIDERINGIILDI
jgi:hypothetical protein